MSSASPWISKPTLTGDAVTLRPFVAADADAMAVILADSEVLRLTGSVTSAEEIRKRSSQPDTVLRDWYRSRGDVDERLDLAIIDRAQGVIVGEVVLNEFDQAANAANFRILIGASGRGRGLGSEATRLILSYGFEALGLHRIELGVFAFNPRAQYVYQKVGFVVEGVRRDAFCFDGQYSDDILMSILDYEWSAHRGYPKP